MNYWKLARGLARAGVLGINSRNANYTLPCNPRKYYPLVDDKLLTKEIAIREGIAVPELYGVIEFEHQIRKLPPLLSQHEDFVIKPAHGSGGDGIIVITGRRRGMYRRASGSLLDQPELNYHVANALSGMFSLGGQPDKVIIEYRVKFDPVFENISYLGVPDVRIIVFHGVPVMAMVRLPTRVSDGKANLHQGAIGAGIDLASGRTLTAVWRNDIVSEHPDTGNPVTGVEIPAWEQMLNIAARAYDMSKLGYLGVDIVLDHDLGPLVLEFNARPGLNIQIANRAGLLKRLNAVTTHGARLSSIKDRIDFARDRFAAAPR